MSASGYEPPPPGVHYECQRCGNCCRWPGVVRLGTGEAEKIAEHLELRTEAFVNQYTELLPDRRGLTLRSKPNGECIFLEDHNHCAIQSAKPQQCRKFPNDWNFPDWQSVCEAIPVQRNKTSKN